MGARPAPMGLVEAKLDENTIIQCWKDGSAVLIQQNDSADHDDQIEIPCELIDELVKRLQETKQFSPYKST